jgi:hypothetical protein
MYEEIQKLIKKYETRIVFLQTLIEEIDAVKTLSKDDLQRRETARHSRTLWREVLKDLKNIVDKKL